MQRADDFESFDALGNVVQHGLEILTYRCITSIESKPKEKTEK